MSTRKLQQEFDKTNKKIAEGLSVFDDIYDKLMTTEISSQKEKLESDLKKEIKKLQRLRDQLKTWISDTSIKLDKSLIQENRTKIEHAMDQFKDLEKSSKIKQFSNEGLELQSQKTKYNKFTDPEDAKKQEACNYIGDIIDQLNQQNESLELEIHLLTIQLKKTKSVNSYSVQSSIDDCKYNVERNNNHLSKLEKILRNIENENLDPERVDDIKDDLEYYVENNQDEDYVEYDDFYEQLEMADDNDIQGGSGNEDNEENKPETKEEPKEEPKVETKAEPKTETKTESKPDAKVESKPKAEIKSETKSETKVSSEPTNSVANNAVKKGKPAVVPAANPPPLNTAQSYSNIIKASMSSPAATKALPPGLNQAKSSTSSPQRTPQKLNQADESKKRITSQTQQIPSTQPETRSETQLPISNVNKPIFDTVNRLSTLPQSRLHNPLPFQSIVLLLESSLLNCPDSFDAEKPRQYHPTSIHPSSVDYPQEPMYELNSSHLMKKFDNDTLFFCFYYSEGINNLAKWNAAQELSKRGWIFNTDVKQWFLKDNKNGGKNRSMSIIQKEEDEQDKQDDWNKEENYKYFDYEKTWLTRRRENYKFSQDLRETF
mmetsp:Transcript_6052/g.7397  ORF Transcript_6052/g.7397 Transcript_6052/m.7397 type:complete len:603 (-) Transcript_6052:9041-10849(-)